jgi:hypothetical protein
VVDFSVDKYTKDADALTAAFKEYSKSQNLKQDKVRKQPLLEALHKAKELIGQIGSPVRQKQHGEREL